MSSNATFIAGLLIAIATAAPAQQGSFTVGTAAAAPGSTAYGVITIPPGPDSALDIPVAVVRGAKAGPVVAFVSGAHGTEYTSIIALQKLIGRIDPKALTGTVIVAPLLNVPSFVAMTPHVNPVDRKGMNSNYPGDPKGTQSARALAEVQRQILLPSDVVVDLHGGDLDEDLRPYSYWFRGGNAKQDSAGLRLVKAFGLDHIIVTDVNPATNPGRSLSTQALLRGKTVLVAEAGRSGVVTAADLNALVDGSLNVLGELGMIARKVPVLRLPIWLSGTGQRIAATTDGVFSAAVPRDARVTKGQVIGRTTDFLGRPTGDVRAQIDGLVTFVRGVPSMWTGATLANVLPVLSAPPAWKAPPCSSSHHESSRREFLAQAGSCAAHLALVAGAMPRSLWPRSPAGRVVALEPFGALERVSDGVWALISTPLSGDRTTLSNGGIIAGRSAVLAIEGFQQPQGAAWLAGKARELTGKWPTHVVLTHYHSDHANGLAGYYSTGERPVLRATERSRELVLERNQPADASRTAALKDAVLLSASEATTLDLGGRSVRVVPRAGHTDSDMSLELEDPSLIFAGDLFWNGMFPNFVDAVPTKLAASVHALRRVRDTIYVPGHGAVGKAADYDRYIAMLDEVEAAARKAHAAGTPAAEAGAASALSPRLGEWTMFSKAFYPRAFEAWYRELK